METTAKNRLQALDLARGVSVFCVILVHTMWMYGTIETQEGWLGDIIHFVGKGTGMFLIAMGVSFVLSRKQSLKLSVKRAVLLLLVGYGMNFLKFVFPILMGFMPEEFIAAYGWEAPLDFSQYRYLILTGDILQLAGYALFFMGLVNHFVKNKYMILVIALLIIASSGFLRGTHLGIGGVDYFLDVLWSADWNVYFPMFPWFSFILVGMFFGKWYLEKGRNEKVMFGKMLPIGTVLLVVGGAICWYDFDYHFGDFFHLGPGGAIYLIGFNLLLFRLSQFVSSMFKYNSFFAILIYLSKRVTSIYVIQWVIICWGMAFLGYQRYDVIGVLFLIPITVAVTLGIQYVLDLSLKPKEPKLPARKTSLS